ncbi:MAG: SRPBCC family protein [Actinomycetota bacterium]|nr:SRPBCC family protein [Actinomycetota bacterium]
MGLFVLVFDVHERLELSPELAWKSLIDWENAPQWMPGVAALRAAAEPAVGAHIVFVARGKERTSTITALEPGRAITMESAQGGVTAAYHYVIEPSDPGAAEIRLRVDCDVRGPMRLIAPIIRSAIRKADQAQLVRFREWVERPG